MTRRPRAALAAVLAALVLTAGCGGDDEPGADDAPTTDAPVESASDSTAPGSETTEGVPTEPTASAPSETTSEPTTEPTTEATSEPPASAPTKPAPPPSTGPTDPDAPPTTYAEAEQRFDAKGQEPVELARFETPSGIYCALSADFVTGCELNRQGVPDPDYCGSDGPTQNVGRVELTDGGAEPVCNSDTIREPGAKKLRFDSVARSSDTGVTCLAEDVGVTCLDPERSQGFFLGPQEYHVFTA